MEGEFQYRGHLYQYLEEWMSPRGSQTIHGLFYEEAKQESAQMESSAPAGATKTSQNPERAISNMVVVKWSDKVEGMGEKIYDPLCGGLYKEEDGYIVPWPGSDPDAKINGFTWLKEENYRIVPRY